MAYLAGFGQLDPATGLPKKKTPGYTQQQVTTSLALNPQAGLQYVNPNVFAPLAGVNPIGSTSSSDTGGSSPFDVQKLLDSLLNPIKSDLAAQGQVDLAGRNAGINRALVQFGQLPDFGQAQQALGLNIGDIVSPDTAQLAASNPYSATKQLAQQHTDAVQKIRQALAARGMLQSGELGYQLNREQQQYGQAQYNAGQQLLDFINGLQQGYLQSEAQRQATLGSSANNALQQLLGLFPNGLPGSNGGGGGGGGGGSQQTTTGGAPVSTEAALGYLQTLPPATYNFQPAAGTIPDLSLGAINDAISQRLRRIGT